MALLQALLSLITRSAGKILNAIFGWAVRALFGRTSPKEQTWLSALVAAAAAWPVLLAGVAMPRVATLVVSFAHVPKWVPAWTLRVGWAALAALVPIVVGLVVAWKSPGVKHEPMVKRALRGWPITIGLAAAFLVMFVTVPVLRIVSFVRKRRDENVPLQSTAAEYHDVACLVETVLDAHGFELRRAEPSWWVSAPSKILARLGGKAFRHFAPEHIEYFRGPRLEVALYPSGLLLRGTEEELAFAHGLIAEALIATRALQSSDPAAQALESRLHRLWETWERDPESPSLRPALDAIACDLSAIHVPYDDWQIVYRLTLQLDRAVHGEPPLLGGRAQPLQNSPAERRS